MLHTDPLSRQTAGPLGRGANMLRARLSLIAPRPAGANQQDEDTRSRLSRMAPAAFVDSELTADDMRAAELAAEQNEGTPASAGCIEPPPMVFEAYHLGELKGEATGYQAGYISGWKWGTVCGAVLGTCLVASSLLLGRWIGA